MLAALPASAEDNPAAVSVSSRTSSSYTDGSGNTVTTTTSERDGKRETRRTVTGPNGKVLSDTTEDGNGAAKPAAENSKPGGPWLGVHTTELPPALREQLDLPADAGLLVEQLPPDSPAANAGIAQHDILLTLNLTPVATPEQLRAELAKFQPGGKVLVEYLHKARREKAAVTLGKRGNPEDPNAVPPAGAPKLNTAPAFPGGTAKASAKSSTRTVIVGSDGKAKVIETDGDGDPFANMLRDPNVPATMKESLRKMQEQMRDFHKRTQDAAPGDVKPVRKETQ
jgi:membrane-associated protease RseP (regulator of RpoE activity)